ncbi:MAG: 16S rRNA (guanine(527)-N(7))-methyltransferase RsmG [Clostridia bacterium]|nr:16S rRNA (guanine(527)-N(7))-methyltransferase RsmG [Clostridia bacterium]
MVNRETFKALYEAIFRENGLGAYIKEPYIGQFEHFLRLFSEENAKTNLTAVREPAEIVAKHFADCLSVAEHISVGSSLLDVGCGGGFPTVPLAIVRPDLRITAIDSTRKKTDCVERMVRTLGLGNVTVRRGRVEEAMQSDLRGKFDVVTARAVANLRVLAELTLPFVRVGGLLIAMKGARGAEELSEARGAIDLLGGEPERDVSAPLACPVTEGAESEREKADQTGNGSKIVGFCPEGRHILLIRKKKPTPSGYPRAYAAILKRPL